MSEHDAGAGVSREPSRAPAPRTYPGGVRTIGALLIIPGRHLDIGNLTEADTLADSITQALADMREDFPETRRTA